MKKFVVISIIAALIITAGLAHAMSSNGFALEVIKDGAPLAEVDNTVHMPFNTEYNVRLTNSHDVRAVAEIKIDGVKVSNLGDFVIPANGSVDIERYLDKSLTEGKRFKFVSLDDPAVPNPSRAENGTITVTVRLERRPQYIRIIHAPAFWNFSTVYRGNYTFPASLSNSLSNVSCQVSYCSNTSSNFEAKGATVAGSESDQRFDREDFDVCEEATNLSLKMMGLKTGYLRGR